MIVDDRAASPLLGLAIGYALGAAVEVITPGTFLAVTGSAPGDPINSNPTT
jgi:ADP-ribosylglycohydrolase